MSSSQRRDTFCCFCLCYMRDLELQLPSMILPQGVEVLLSSTCNGLTTG